MDIWGYKEQNPDNILLKEINRLIQRTTGQLNWVPTQTRPDLAFYALSLSVILNKATFRDAISSKKTAWRAKKNKVNLKFSHLGDWKKLQLEVFMDASLGNMEKDNETRSVMGLYVAISNENLDINALHWKENIIDKVAEDIKTAETLALEAAVDYSLHLADMISEIYTGEPMIIKFHWLSMNILHH